MNMYLFYIFFIHIKRIFIESYIFYSLLQAALGQIPIDSTALFLDSEKCIQIADRIVNSIIEFLQTDQLSNNCFDALLSCIILAKSIRLSLSKAYDRIPFRKLIITHVNSNY